MNGTARWHSRGNPPPRIASLYSEPEQDAPEQSGVNRGGTWTADGKPGGSKLKKSDLGFDQVILDNGGSPLKRGAGCVVLNGDNHILLGRRTDDFKWVTPGGHVEEGEDFKEGACRELLEETGLRALDPIELAGGVHGNYDTRTFLVRDVAGDLRGNGELTDLQFFDLNTIPWNNMRDYAAEAIRAYANHIPLSKSRKLKDLETAEILSKALARYDASNVAQIVGSGAFKFLKESIAGMEAENPREIPFDTYVLVVRKHFDDSYSGEVRDGHKVVHKFVNCTPQTIALNLMGLFEWYSPEDEGLIGELSDTVPDVIIADKMKTLSDDYKKNNLANIYTEMENIRKEVRNGVAVDVQQVEARITKLFDKLEEYVNRVAGKHNELSRAVGSEIDELEAKIKELQAKVEQLAKVPSDIEAIQTKPVDPIRVLDEEYCYLSKPQIEVSPNGKIKISFPDDWQDLEKENLLRDLRAKVVKKVTKDD